MREMFVLGEPVDFVTVLEKLKENRDFDQDTGKVYLTQLAQLVPSIDNVEVYAQIVRDKYDLRTLMQAARSILDEASEGSEEPSLLLDAAEEKIYRIRQGKTVAGPAEAQRGAAGDLRPAGPAQQPRQGPVPGPAHGHPGAGQHHHRIEPLGPDHRGGPPRRGQDQPGAEHRPARGGDPRAGRWPSLSLEMGKEQLASRLLASEALVEGTKLRSGDLTNDEWTRLVEASDILGKAPLYLDDSPDITAQKMKAKLLRLKDVDLVMVDYLQLMTSPKRSDNRVNEVAEITRSLKIMAKELNVPVVALSQLRRPTERTKDHRPRPFRAAGLRPLSNRTPTLSCSSIGRPTTPSARAGRCLRTWTRTPASSSWPRTATARPGTSPVHWQGEYMRFTSREVIRGE